MVEITPAMMEAGVQRWVNTVNSLVEDRHSTGFPAGAWRAELAGMAAQGQDGWSKAIQRVQDTLVERQHIYAVGARGGVAPHDITGTFATGAEAWLRQQKDIMAAAGKEPDPPGTIDWEGGGASSLPLEPPARAVSSSGAGSELGDGQAARHHSADRSATTGRSGRGE